MPSSLTVVREIFTSGNYRRLLVTVSAAAGLDSGVFLYRQLPQRESEPTPTGVFEGVCSPADMEAHPRNEPLEGAEPPWFRLDSVDLLLPSESELISAWQVLSEQLQTLLTTLANLEVTTESEAFEFSAE